MAFDTDVFINCPFDYTYINDLLKPMIYVLVRNGFTPRLSLEVSDSGQYRLEKITSIIRECKYSIHDLSIVKSKKKGEFARMNMPFELGIDYGLRNSGVCLLDTKKFLILEAVKYDYQKALSDINGFDIKVHDNDTEKIFDCLYTWLSETLKLNKKSPPLQMFNDFLDFNSSLFNEKKIQFGIKKIAINYVEKVSIPEYIHEVRDSLIRKN